MLARVNRNTIIRIPQAAPIRFKSLRYTITVRNFSCNGVTVNAINAVLTKRRKRYNTSLEIIIRTRTMQKNTTPPITTVTRVKQHTGTRLPATFVHPMHTLTNNVNITMVAIQHTLTTSTKNKNKDKNKHQDQDQDQDKHQDKNRQDKQHTTLIANVRPINNILLLLLRLAVMKVSLKNSRCNLNHLLNKLKVRAISRKERFIAPYFTFLT